MKQTQSLQDHYRWCSAIHCKDGLPYSLAAARLSLDNPPKPTNKQNLSVATQFGAAVLRRLSYPTPQAKTMFLTSPLKQKPFCGSTTSQCQLHAGDQPQTTGGTTTDTPHKSEINDTRNAAGHVAPPGEAPPVMLFYSGEAPPGMLHWSRCAGWSSYSTVANSAGKKTGPCEASGGGIWKPMRGIWRRHLLRISA